MAIKEEDKSFAMIGKVVVGVVVIGLGLLSAAWFVLANLQCAGVRF